MALLQQALPSLFARKHVNSEEGVYCQQVCCEADSEALTAQVLWPSGGQQTHCLPQVIPDPPIPYTQRYILLRNVTECRYVECRSVVWQACRRLPTGYG